MRAIESQIIELITRYNELSIQITTLSQELLRVQAKRRELSSKLDDKISALLEAERQSTQQEKDTIEKKAKEIQEQRQLLRHEQDTLEEERLNPALEGLLAESLGQTTLEFLSHEILSAHLAPTSYGNFIDKNKLRFKLLIEYYLTTLDSVLKQRLLSEIESIMITIGKASNKPNGQGLLPPEITHAVIRGVYLSNNRPLISLFEAALPKPSAEMFVGGPVPPDIERKAAGDAAVALKFLKGRNIDEVVAALKTVQRMLRARPKARGRTRTSCRTSGITLPISCLKGKKRSENRVSGSNIGRSKHALQT
jgi:hypothetical protein